MILKGPEQESRGIDMLETHGIFSISDYVNGSFQQDAFTVVEYPRDFIL